jgi:hypothetical protein
MLDWMLKNSLWNQEEAPNPSCPERRQTAILGAISSPLRRRPGNEVADVKNDLLQAGGFDAGPF